MSALEIQNFTGFRATGGQALARYARSRWAAQAELPALSLLPPLRGRRRPPMLIEPPEIQFSPWVRWADRQSLRRSDGPWLGVYLWARFCAGPGPSDRPDPNQLPAELIYVGETKELDRRPLGGRHHRLAHYRDTFPADRQFAHLYLAVWRVHQFPGGYATSAARKIYPSLRVYTQFVEAKLYWDYTRRWERPPALHYKKGSADPGAS